MSETTGYEARTIHRLLEFSPKKGSFQKNEQTPLVLTHDYILLQRNLIYTAVTRGRKLVVMVGSKKALAIAVKNNKTQMRHTRLSKKLSLTAAQLK